MIETERLRHQQDGMKKQAETERADLLMKMTDAFEYDVQGFLDRLAQSAVEMTQTSEHMLTTRAIGYRWGQQMRSMRLRTARSRGSIPGSPRQQLIWLRISFGNALAIQRLDPAASVRGLA